MDEKIGSIISDDQAMSLAIELAEQGNGWVSPNPKVGCVILDSKNKLLGFGFHKKFGGPHAEVEAIKTVDPSLLIGARIFVTLEPCAHEGKTPSCAKMLIKYPIAEVIIGLEDPNPLVAGQGIQILKSAGIKVSFATENFKDRLEEVAEHFLMNFKNKKVWISLKVAVSLDGSLALATGESRWITGSQSREYAHFLRATHDAILVGVNTLFQDDPSLDVRHSQFPGKNNKVIILDPFARGIEKIEASQMFQKHRPEDIYFVVGPEAKTKSIPKGIQIIGVPWVGTQLTEKPNKETKILDLDILNRKLFELGIRSLLVEGGASTHSEYLKQGQAHRLYQFIAPTLLGGARSINWTRGLSIDSMDHQKRLKNPRYHSFGQDILITGLL